MTAAFYITMDINEVKIILTKLGSQFDSHDFIQLFIQNFPSSYAKILEKHNNVNTAHGEIARFLYSNASSLNIRFIENDSVTPNIYNNLSSNAKWHKII